MTPTINVIAKQWIAKQAHIIYPYEIVMLEYFASYLAANYQLLPKESVECVPPIHREGCEHRFDGISIPVRKAKPQEPVKEGRCREYIEYKTEEDFIRCDKKLPCPEHGAVESNR